MKKMTIRQGFHNTSNHNLKHAHEVLYYCYIDGGGGGVGINETSK